ncbi:MAG TPA: hypothetical protein VLM05_00065 [Mycobacteriales bacterium]|nr:hypothetical protein [Mycobacteriales bacterium]
MSRRVDPGRVLAVASVVPALVAAGWLLVAYPLALAGHARPWIAVPLAVVAVAALLAAVRRLPALPDTPWWPVLSTGAIAAAFTAYAAAHAGGHVVLRRDSAVYALFARWIADTGGFVIPAQLQYIGGGSDKVVSATAQGLYPAGDNLTTQFMSGTALTLAPFGWGTGWGVLLLVPALIGGCAVLAFAGLAARLLGARWAPAAALVLALTLPMLLTFRTTYSEPLAQLLLLTALCLLLDAVAGRHRGVAAMAGLLVGLGLLVRIDAVRDIALLIPVVGWLAYRRNPCWWPLLLGTAAGALYGVVDARGPAHAYVTDLGALVRTATKGGIALAVLAVVGVLIGRRWTPRVPAWAGTAAGAVVAVVLVAIALRPWWHLGVGVGKGTDVFIAGLQQAQGLPVQGTRNYSEQSVHWVSWYAGWPALVLAGAGAVLLVRQAVLRRGDLLGRPAARWVLGLGLPLVSALSVLMSPGITPDHPWADRRLVPTILPVVTLLAVWAVAVAVRRWGRAALAAGLVVLLVPPVLGSRHLAPTRTEAGEPAAVDTACAAFAPGEVALMVDARARQEWTAVLREACDVPAFSVPGTGTDDVATRAQVTDVAARVRAAGGVPVLVGTAGDLLPGLTTQSQRQLVDLDSSEYQRLLLSVPRALTGLKIELWRANAD